MKKYINRFITPQTYFDKLFGFLEVWIFSSIYIDLIFKYFGATPNATFGWLLNLLRIPILILFIILDFVSPSSEGLGSIGAIIFFGQIFFMFIFVAIPILNKILFKELTFFIPTFTLLLFLIYFIFNLFADNARYYRYEQKMQRNAYYANKIKISLTKCDISNNHKTFELTDSTKSFDCEMEINNLPNDIVEDIKQKSITIILTFDSNDPKNYAKEDIDNYYEENQHGPYSLFISFDNESEGKIVSAQNDLLKLKFSYSPPTNISPDSIYLSTVEIKNYQYLEELIRYEIPNLKIFLNNNNINN